MNNVQLSLTAVFLSAFLFFVSCEKEETNHFSNSSDSVMCTGMLRFSSLEDFTETQQKIFSMSESERREWEKGQGFKSYATKCFELLEELESNGISSDEDIISFVKKNSDIYYIREDNGDFYLSTYLEDSWYYYIMNEDQMLQIGNMTAKVFDEGCVWVNSSDAYQLYDIQDYQIAQSIADSVCSNIENSTNLALFAGNSTESSTSETTLKDKYPIITDSIWTDSYSNTCISYIGQRITQKNFIYTEANRNVIKAKIYHIDITGPDVCRDWTCEVTLTPYHRVAGIWYRCQRTTNYSIRGSFETGWLGTLTYNQNGSGSGYLTTVYVSPLFHSPINVNYSGRISVFSGWASTLDTPTVYFPRSN